jgi:hypothetical protein
MKKFWKAGAAMLGVLGWAACSSPTSPTTLTATLTATPNPASATASQGVSYTIVGDATHADVTKVYPFTTSFLVDIEETGGIALNITAVNLKVQQASGGIVIAPSGGEVEHFQFNSSASGNLLPAKGHASVGFQVWYDLPNKGKEALVTVSLSFQEVTADSTGVQQTFQTSVAEKISP